MALKAFLLPQLLFSLCIFNFLHQIQSLDYIKHLKQEPEQTEIVDDCKACQLLVESFDKGLERTSRGKHEGGDTSWEERKLRKYAESEVRLAEIVEDLCYELEDKKRTKCLRVLEDAESRIEEWWLGERTKNVRLNDVLCISKLKLCCPHNTFGPTCQPCPSNCSNRGSCDGIGTRKGTGACNCDLGYAGEQCDKCDTPNYFKLDAPISEDATDDKSKLVGQFQCLACDDSCAGCSGLGPKNCNECKAGYKLDEVLGCKDIDECDNNYGERNSTCTKNEYCLNTSGSYKCLKCDRACDGCFGPGAMSCESCAPNYELDDSFVCRSQAELLKEEARKKEEELKVLIDSGYFQKIRYGVYTIFFGLSLLITRRNRAAVLISGCGFFLFLVFHEFYDYTDNYQQYSIPSSS